MPRIALVSGKPVRDGTVLSALCEHLRDRNVDVAVHVMEVNGQLPPHVLASQLLLQRALAPAQLSRLLPLERDGVRCCNRIAATIALRNRHRTSRVLAENGLPVPQTTLIPSWREVRLAAHDRGVVVKSAEEFTGRGGAVLKAAAGTLPPSEPFAGPYVLQEYVAGDDRDYKVYVAGDRSWGLIKSHAPDPQIETFEVNRELSGLARHVGSALRLEIYGVDILYGPSGPVIVDVNPFPGFRGVPQAPPWIADYALQLVSRDSTP